MKRILLILCAVAAVALASCSNEKYDGDLFGLTYCTVVSDSGRPVSTDFYLLADNNNILYVASTLIPAATFNDGDRLLVNFTITGQATDKYNYKVRLNAADYILCKMPIEESFILLDEEVRNDSIGHTPVSVQNAWFGGKYLNIDFAVYTSPSSDTRHFINLVHDDTIQNDTAYLYLRHNDFGLAWAADGTVIAGSQKGSGMVSFDLSEIAADKPEGLPIRLIWTDYSGRTYSDTGVFKGMAGSGNTGGIGSSQKASSATGFFVPAF